MSVRSLVSWHSQICLSLVRRNWSATTSTLLTNSTSSLLTTYEDMSS